jgi:hypothetical protein
VATVPTWAMRFGARDDRMRRSGSLWMAVGLAVLTAACSFDTSRLDDLRLDAPLDLLQPDLGDVSDVDDDVADDPVADPGDDPDAPLDVADVPLDPDVAEDVSPDAEDVDADVGPNQPPVLTAPATLQVEEFLSVELNVGVDDPDAGEGELAVVITVTGGVVSFIPIPAGFTFTAGDGRRNVSIAGTASLPVLQDALGALVFHATAEAPGQGSVGITVNDQGNTGTGEALSDSVTVAIDILEREYDFRVQRGYAIITSNQLTVTLAAGVDYVAPTGPAFVRLVNTRLSGMGRTSGGGRKPPGRWMVVVANGVNGAGAMTNGPDLSTSIVFRRGTSHSENTRVAWEIVEYIGEPNGPNAVSVLETGVMRYSSAAGDVALQRTVPDLPETDAVVVFITGQLTPSTEPGDTHRGLSTSAWDAETSTAHFRRGAGGSTSEVSYAVVRFGGASWHVQRAEHSYTSVTGTETLEDSVEPSRAFLHVQQRTSSTDMAGAGALVSIESQTTVRFTMMFDDFSIPQVSTTVAWVVSNSQSDEGAMRTVELAGQRDSAGGEEDIWTQEFPEDVEPVRAIERSSIMGETALVLQRTTDAPRGSIVLLLRDDPAEPSTPPWIELRQSEVSSSKRYRFFVVEWPDQL